jgi:hypothetical protein
MTFRITFDAARYFSGDIKPYCLSYQQDYDSGTSQRGFYWNTAGYFETITAAKKAASVVKEKNEVIEFNV